MHWLGMKISFYLIIFYICSNIDYFERQKVIRLGRIIPLEMSVQQRKLLGITIVSDLKWEVHGTNIEKQANLAPTLEVF